VPPPANTQALHHPPLNVELGTALLASLLEQYGGSRVKVLAAYNAGEDAVAKWERRYEGRDTDEFVELISYRETRDYVKTVLSNYRRYKRLYAASA
jgi:soluble lytic murein transglycosylase